AFAHAAAFDTAVAQLAHMRMSVIRRFWIACGVFAAGAATAIAASEQGGTIWTGGMLVGALLWWRCMRGYLALRQVAPGIISSGALLAAAGAVVGCLALGGIAAAALLEAQSTQTDLPAATGSCWRQATSDKLEQVSCAVSHQYEATLEVDNGSLCPPESAGYTASAS